MSKIEAIKKELKQAKELSQADHLEAVLYEFVKLHESMSNDAYKRDTEVGGRIKQLTSQLQEFEKLAEKVRSDIHTSIRQEAENTAIYYGKTMGEAARNRVDSAIANLQQAASEATITLKRYQAEVRMTQWKIIGASIAASVFACSLIMFFLMPKPTLPLTDFQLQRYELGNAFYDLWTTLPREKKDWFLKKSKLRKIS